MGFFDTAQKALSTGKSVFFGELYELQFTAATGYYWDGFGDLTAHGATWSGAAGLVQRSEIPFGLNDEAGNVALTMSGVDSTVVTRMRQSEAQIYQRPILIWGQFFNEAMQPDEARFQLFNGTMDVPTYVGSGDRRTIIIPCEGEWADRNGAVFEFFTDASQQHPDRFPGDKGLEYVYRYNPGVKRNWPQFPAP
jgi:hypothetical protein